MHILIGFAILVVLFAVFPRTATRFAIIGAGALALGLVISILAQTHR